MQGGGGGKRQRVGHTCEAVWTAGLAWPPHPPLAPVCPTERPGISHTLHPGPGSSVGVGGRGLEARHQERAWSRGWGWGALSHPDLQRDPHRDLTSCHRRVAGGCRAQPTPVGHSYKLETGFSRPPELPAWRNQGMRRPVSKRGALQRMIRWLKGSSICRTLGQIVLLTTSRPGA